jgi:hypothetical protein
MITAEKAHELTQRWELAAVAQRYNITRQECFEVLQRFGLLTYDEAATAKQRGGMTEREHLLYRYCWRNCSPRFSVIESNLQESTP